jgi:hypothetical protein
MFVEALSFSVMRASDFLLLECDVLSGRIDPLNYTNRHEVLLVSFHRSCFKFHLATILAAFSLGVDVSI